MPKEKAQARCLFFVNLHTSCMQKGKALNFLFCAKSETLSKMSDFGHSLCLPSHFMNAKSEGRDKMSDIWLLSYFK